MNTIIPDSSISIFYNTTNGHLEDIVDAFDQFHQNPTTLAFAFFGVMVKINIILNRNIIFIFFLIIFQISIAAYKTIGIAISNEIPATWRMILEMIRTMIIWIFSNYIIPPFYKDYWFLLLAFAVILAGRCIYNDVFFGNFVLSY